MLSACGFAADTPTGRWSRIRLASPLRSALGAPRSPLGPIAELHYRSHYRPTHKFPLLSFQSGEFLDSVPEPELKLLSFSLVNKILDGHGPTVNSYWAFLYVYFYIWQEQECGICLYTFDSPSLDCPFLSNNSSSKMRRQVLYFNDLVGTFLLPKVRVRKVLDHIAPLVQNIML